MATSIQLRDAWRTIAPIEREAHGRLPQVLLLLTVVTGLVDSFSYLRLGHVFVANMTGNVVFLAFALAGAAGFSVWSSLIAIAAFLLGAVVGGRISHRHAKHRGRMTLVAIFLQMTIMLAAFIVALIFGPGTDIGPRFVLTALMACGMGIQNAVSRALGVPDLTTTVLTLTITGISADSKLGGGSNSKAGRRLLSILSMFLGACLGAILVLHGLAPWVLLIVVVLLAIVTATSVRLARSTEPWTSHA
jgi:uncharacterized membrane protein YoaK (UPF0700 family)